MNKDVKAFLKTKRKGTQYRPINERVKDYKEVAIKPALEDSYTQASRCMDCGTPFCHWACPIGNYIPELNDLILKKQWERAYQLLSSVNCMPEITGRICPALCESACILGLTEEPVTNRENELAIIEYAFKNNLVDPKIPEKTTGKKIAIIGSGPAGLACADRLSKLGHEVVVYEKDEHPGGILRFGIPDFKLDKQIVDRRINVFRKQGIDFKTNTEVGKDIEIAQIKKDFDAMCLTGGSREPRDVNIPGRDFKGIYFAMDYLMQSNRRVSGIKIHQADLIDAKNKNVVVIGGGDTGCDCVGTANRQGAKGITQIELLPRPSEERPEKFPWPTHPPILKVTSSHEEGCKRDWSISTKRFVGSEHGVSSIDCIRVDENLKEIPGAEFTLKADLILLAIGFIHPEHSKMLKDLEIKFDKRGNVVTDKNYMTNVKGIFSAGDMHKGQSLVCWAINEGKEAADAINTYLR